MKKLLKHTFLRFFSSGAFQPFFTLLMKLSLKGMNVGGGAYEPKTSGEARLLKQLKATLPPNAVIFDVGANIGQYSAIASSVFPNAQFYCFEPVKKSFEKLAHKFAAHKNITTRRLALGETKSSLPIFYSEERSVQSSLVLGTTERMLHERINIETLDQFCLDNEIDHIDFLKIDVEGYELFVLKGAKKMITEGRIKIIQFEFGNHQIVNQHFFIDFVTLLQEYDLYRILQRGLSKLDYSTYSELFLVTNYLAVRKEISSTL